MLSVSKVVLRHPKRFPDTSHCACHRHPCVACSTTHPQEQLVVVQVVKRRFCVVLVFRERSLEEHILPSLKEQEIPAFPQEYDEQLKPSSNKLPLEGSTWRCLFATNSRTGRGSPREESTAHMYLGKHLAVHKDMGPMEVGRFHGCVACGEPLLASVKLRSWRQIAVKSTSQRCEVAQLADLSFTVLPAFSGC